VSRLRQVGGDAAADRAGAQYRYLLAHALNPSERKSYADLIYQ
jgi:hypothetical protein